MISHDSSYSRKSRPNGNGLLTNRTLLAASPGPVSQLKVGRAETNSSRHTWWFPEAPISCLGSWMKKINWSFLLREVSEEEWRVRLESSSHTVLPGTLKGPRGRPPQSASWSLVMFLWCMLWWRTNSSDRANFFWQLGHRQLKGFSPVWVLVWVFRWSDRENFRWQVLHWNGFTPVCLLWCLLSWSERENLRSQSLKSHWYGFSPVCFLLCICKWDSLKYLLLQPG